jgi:hypothetical protein
VKHSPWHVHQRTVGLTRRGGRTMR